MSAALGEMLTVSTGRYEIRDELGSGGSATVYRATDRELGAEVALKVMDGDVRDEKAAKRFFRQAEIARTLLGATRRSNPGGHGTIAEVQDLGYLGDGPRAGRPYLALALYPGTIADCLDRYRGRAKPCAELVRAIATTVAVAHTAGIAHGDLKPGNVLMTSLDGHGTPVLTDFGAARSFDEAKSAPSTGLGLGTLEYMAREQALLRPSYDKARADVYGLGAILYHLLVGHPLYEGTDAERLRGVLSNAPVPSPRSRGVRVARDLELVCLCCLEKRPRLRYGSAVEVADELGAFLDGRPPRIAQLGWPTRSLRACVRHPFGIALAGFAVVLALAAGLVGLWSTGGLEATLRDQITRANAQAAKATAGQVLLLLRGFGDSLRPCSKHPVIVDHLGSHRGRGGGALVAALETCAPPATFDSVLLLDLGGCPVGRSPVPRADYFERCFEFRDYYRGAERLAARRVEWQRLRPEARGPDPEDFYIARAHRSEGDQQFKFSLGMPVFDAPLGNPDAKCVGYLMATLGTDSTIASYPLSDPNDPGRLGSVVSLRDRERTEANQPLPREFRVLIHRDLRHGDAVRIATPELDRFADTISREQPYDRQQFHLLRRSDVMSSSDHRDPIPGYWGRWLAGFARVGQTDQIVIVETRYDTITVVEEYLWRVLGCAGLLLVVGFATVSVALAALRKRAWV